MCSLGFVDQVASLSYCVAYEAEVFESGCSGFGFDCQLFFWSDHDRVAEVCDCYVPTIHLIDLYEWVFDTVCVELDCFDVWCCIVVEDSCYDDIAGVAESQGDVCFPC